MNAEAQLSRLLGSFADQRELIKNMDELDLNNLAQELENLIKTSENGINHRDYSGVSIAQVINELIQSPYLDSKYVGGFMVLYINEYNGFRKSRTRGICNFINHPNISKADFLNGFLFYFNQGLFLYFDGDKQEYQINPRSIWQEDITPLMELSFCRLKQVFFDIGKFDELIVKSIEFFNIHSPSSIENDNFKNAAFALLDKLSPERICKTVAKSKDEQTMIKFPEKHLDLFLDIKKELLSRYSKIPYSKPVGYGGGTY